VRHRGLPDEQQQLIEELARQFRLRHLVSSRGEAEAIARTFRRALFSGQPGRPRHEDVTQAMRLLREGKSRWQICKELGKDTPEKRHSLWESIRNRKARVKRRLSNDATKSIPVLIVN
jgi:hypothetical protein